MVALVGDEVLQKWWVLVGDSYIQKIAGVSG